MNYQKASTGLRIGVSVSIIILMLGVTISLDIFTTHTITNQVKTTTNLSMPIIKELTQMYATQQIQQRVFEDALTYHKLNDQKNYELVKEQFYSYNNAFDNQFKNINSIMQTTTDNTSDDNTYKQISLIVTNLNEINSLHSEYLQIANQLFNSYDNGLQNVEHLSDIFQNKQNQLDQRLILLNDEIQKLANNLEASGKESEQESLTVQIVIIFAVGVISIALGYFLHQINKDLINEVISKTKSLQKANKKLQKLNVQKDDFINIASHELKSPLNPIYGFVELAQNGDIGKEEALAGILNQARQLEEVANRILDMSKIDKGKLQLSYEKFNLNNLVLEIANTYRMNLNENVTIEINLENEVYVEADRVRIGQVIRNLLNNALKFTNKGKILMTVKLDQYKDFVEVMISDEGSGIHPEILPNLFNKFVTKGHDTKSWEGNGLGLYLCRGIINAHGGHISAHNNKISGATMRFTIPITKYQNVKELHQNIVN